jgi:Tfp pilus assembly protein PilE
MGQQQLLLIVLGVIIVGIAIAVGISMFKSNAVTSNRDQVINDLNNLAAKAQQYFRKPATMAGGGQSFAQFQLTPTDLINANGKYGLAKAAPSGPSADTSGTTNIIYAGDTPGSPTAQAQDTVLYIVGWGTEVGNDNVHHVEAYIQVTPTLPGATTVIN